MLFQMKKTFALSDILVIKLLQEKRWNTGCCLEKIAEFKWQLLANALFISSSFSSVLIDSEMNKHQGDHTLHGSSCNKCILYSSLNVLYFASSENIYRTVNSL